MPKPINLLGQIHAFLATLSREDFYDFYSLMTSLAGPKSGDFISVDGQKINLKHIVRRLRITVMHPRFEVDYADAYTPNEALKEYEMLKSVFDSPTIRSDDRDAVAKIMKSLLTVYRGFLI